MKWNIDIKDIGKLFKGGSPKMGRAGLYPHRDWKIMFTLFTCVYVGIALFCGYMFWQINRGEFVTALPEDVVATSAIDTTRLTEAVKYFEAKKENVASFKDKRLHNIDPSL